MIKIALLGAGGNAARSWAESVRLEYECHITGYDSSPYAESYADWCDAFVVHDFDHIKIKQDLIAGDFDFIHAQPDTLVKVLCELQYYNEDIKKRSFALDDMAIFTCGDKLTLSDIWARTFDDFPRSYGMDDAWQTELDGVKKWVRAVHGAGSKMAMPCDTNKEVLDWTQYWINRGASKHDFMIARFLPGPEYATQQIWVDGELYQSQSRERVEYFFGSIMPSGQSSTPSVARITVGADDVLAKATQAVQAAVRVPHGIFGVDMKTSEDGVLVPTEINYGRFYTTSNFFASLGVNSPADVVAYVVEGKEIPDKIETIDRPFMWMRGIDREPKLVCP